MSIVKNEDLPEMMRARQDCAHEIAREAFEQVWNHATQVLSHNDKQISGNDALAYFGTIICNISARWIVEMDKIAKSDEAGVLTEDLIKEFLNGTLGMLGAKAEFEEEKPLPNGIKRINNEMGNKE